MDDDEDFIEIPEEAFAFNGECDFCDAVGPVAEIGFGPVLIDEDTGEILEDEKYEMVPTEEHTLCKVCAQIAIESNQPLEHVEAEIKDMTK